jgi:hypothetical protein
MKELLKKIDEWAASAIKFIRPRKHKSSNVLSDDVHLKDKQITDAELQGFEKERVITPQQYYVTREGQMMRKPEKKKVLPYAKI